MGIFNDKNNNEEQTSLEYIKSTYYDIKNKKWNCEYYYTSLLLDLHCHFATRFRMLYKDKDLKELEEAIKFYDQKDSSEVIEKMNNIIKESQDIEKKAEEEFTYNSVLLGNLWRYGRSIKGPPREACEDIINRQIKSYIIYEKNIIILKDKIKELSLII
jgi:hypothetical protein